jgi:SAM-dependent methyltransferase
MFASRQTKPPIAPIVHADGDQHAVDALGHQPDAVTRGHRAHGASLTLGTVGFEELKARQSEIWGSAPWERVAPTLAPVHEHLVRALGPTRGARWLDLATGTGALALLAARDGAEVTGLDLAPKLIETARRLAADQGVNVRFDVGDAEAIPRGDASFTVVSSSMGIIFAPDHEAVAREVARVCVRGGRIGFSAWREGAGFTPLTRRYSPELLPGQGDPVDWGREEHAEALLGSAFELAFEEGDAPVVASSGEEMWELLLASSGPFRARAADLPPARLEEFHREFVELLEAHRQGDKIHLPAPYLVIIGTRR